MILNSLNIVLPCIRQIIDGIGVMFNDPDQAQDQLVVFWSELLQPMNNDDFENLQAEFAEMLDNAA